MLHGHELRQEPGPLLAIAEAVDHPGRHVVDGKVGRGGRAGSGQLLEDDRGVEPRQARAALILAAIDAGKPKRSEEHTSELQSLMRNSYAVLCLKKKHKKGSNTDST